MILEYDFYKNLIIILNKTQFQTIILSKLKRQV